MILMKVKPLAIFISVLFILGTVLFISRSVAAKNTIPEASGAVVLTDKQGEYPLGLHMEILEDPTRELTIDEVSSPAYDDKFFASSSEVPIFGFTDSAYWVRIHIRNETRNINDWLLDIVFSNMQFVDFYTPLPNNEGFTVKQSGSLRPPSTRDLHYPRVIFTYAIPPHEQNTIYLRFQSGTSMTLNLTLWRQILFFNNALLEQIAFGIFFGILIGLLFYNLFIYFSLREASYFYITLFLAAVIIHEASYNGFLETYIIPGLYFSKVYYHPALFAALISSIVLFADSFLEVRKQSPKLHWVAIASVTGFGILVLLIPFASYLVIARLMVYWALASLFVTLVFGIFNYVSGKFPKVQIFMYAWFGTVVLFLGVLLVRLGVLPSTFYSENIYRLVIVLVAIFWSVSLADRVNLLKAETDNANQELNKSEKRLSQILESMPLAVVLYGKDHKPRYGNRRTNEILTDAAQGIWPDISAGRTLSQAIEYFSLKMTGSHDPYPLENLPVYHALKGNPAFADDIEIQKQGKLVPLEMWSSPILDESGKVESAVVVFQDISQRKMADESLIEYRKHLESLVDERTADLNAANRELRLRLEWLAAVNLVNQMIARSAEFSQIYERVVEIVNHLFSVQNSFIAELYKETGQLRLLAHSESNVHPDLIGSFIAIPTDIQIMSSPEPGRAVIIPGNTVSDPYQPLYLHAQESNVQNIAFVPLQVREQVLGFLGLELHEGDRTITSEESNLLTSFSIDIAQLIEDARLFEQSKLLVAADERNRLARELHDSVAQTLYSISLFIDATRLALKTNKPKVVESHLEDLNQLSREAMTDMRLLIFELRPPILEKSGLAAALQSRLESVEAKAGFETRFETGGTFHLLPTQESELYRIAQEALNNVIKHAQAKRVTIYLVQESGCVRMTIEDDGVGFDPSTAEHGGGQGFRNMRERSANIGARCSFESIAGQGTKIRIEVNE